MHVELLDCLGRPLAPDAAVTLAHNSLAGAFEFHAIVRTTNFVECDLLYEVRILDPNTRSTLTDIYLGETVSPEPIPVAALDLFVGCDQGTPGLPACPVIAEEKVAGREWIVAVEVEADRKFAATEVPIGLFCPERPVELHDRCECYCNDWAGGC